MHFKWTQLRRSLVKRRREDRRRNELDAERAREENELKHMALEELAMRRLAVAATVSRRAISIGSRQAWAKRSFARERRMDAFAERELISKATVEHFGTSGEIVVMLLRHEVSATIEVVVIAAVAGATPPRHLNVHGASGEREEMVSARRTEGTQLYVQERTNGTQMW